MNIDCFVYNVKSYCQMMGISPSKACAESGAGKSFLDNIKRGRVPSVDSVQLLAQYFGVTISELLGEEKSASISEDARKLAKDYDTLDSWGKKQVRSSADIEMARCQDEKRFQEETAMSEQEPKIIPLYLYPDAAGLASPDPDVDFSFYTLKPDDPQGATFAVKLDGDSMEPDFPDRSIVFCNRDPLRDGDIGIFSVDGGTVCKQYHEQGGVVYLFSLNRKRQDADVVLLPSGNRTFTCQGRVITKRRYPVPGWNK